MHFFDQIIDHHIEIEGGLVDHPDDPGGVTKYGISQRFNPDIDVRHLTIPQAKEYYRVRYWDVMKLDLINRVEIARELFDQGAGPQGPKMAVILAQMALVILKRDVVIDGVMGPKTAYALNSYPHTKDLVKLMNCLQFVQFLLGGNNINEIIEMVKGRLPALHSFMRGWLKRVTI